MSRHIIPGKESYLKVVVGWDNGLESFFGIVYDTRYDDPCAEHRILLEAGTGLKSLREIVSVEELADAIRQYADIPQETMSQLVEDFSSRGPGQPAIFRELVERTSEITDE